MNNYVAISASIFIGAIIQIAIIWGMRVHALSFWIMIPAIVVCQYLFITAYARAPSFSVVWFMATFVVNLSAVIAGRFLFDEALGIKQYVGIGMLVTGIIVFRLP